MITPRIPRQGAPVEDRAPATGPLRLMPLPKGRRVIHGDASLLVGRSIGQSLAWVVLVLAAGVDVATFYQVIVLVLDAPPAIVLLAVIGFTVVALTLAHHAGSQYRAANGPAGVVGARAGAWAYFGIWLTLGLTAFLVRWTVSPNAAGSSIVVDGKAIPPDAGEVTTRHLAALLFLVLYVATGAVSAYAGKEGRDPAVRRWRRADRRRRRAARRVAELESQLSTATALRAAIAGERERWAQRWDRTQQQSEVATTGLAHEARLLMRRRAPHDRGGDTRRQKRGES